MSTIRACTLLTNHKKVEENIHALVHSSPSGDDKTGLEVLVRKVWGPGQTLGVSFIGGSTFMHYKVQQYAKDWEQFANIRFDFNTAAPATIRVAFQQGLGSWSYLGTDALRIPASDPTMNFGWLTDQTSDSEFSRVVTHEFGHALGCVHTHQQPKASIQWDKPAVYRYYEGTWTKEEVDSNIFKHYNTQADNIQSSDLVLTSIMEYPIPKEFTTNGFSVELNDGLSSEDKSYIQVLYPFPVHHDTIDIGTFNTMSIRPWNQPTADNIGTLAYPSTFSTTPSVLLGINWIDLENDRGARLACETIAGGVNTQSARINMRSWGDTVQYSSGCAAILIPANNDDLQFGTFNTMDDHDWRSPQSQTSCRIGFPRAYSSPPKVVSWLTSFDINFASADLRVRVYVTNVDANGFTIHLDSWGDTLLWSAGASWFACPANRSDIDSGVFNTVDIRPWQNPCALTKGRIAYAGTNFSELPKVFVAFNSLDVDKSWNARVRISTSDPSTQGITWHLDSWSDTSLYAAGATYIVFSATSSQYAPSTHHPAQVSGLG